MEQIKQTLQIVSIQHELAMSIGKSLHLESMLTNFFTTAQRRLSLNTIYLFYKPTNVEHESDPSQPNKQDYSYLCFPKQHESDTEQQGYLAQYLQPSALSDQTSTLQTIENKDKLFYIFSIPTFGWIILARLHSAIEPAILSALPPIFSRLAISCLACLEHRDLLIEVEARKAAEKMITRQIYTDTLTNLPNRKLLSVNLNKAIGTAKRNSNFGALFFIDLDRFKIINDTMGHGVGDELLVALAVLLKQCISEGETLARVGGDEFILLMPNISQDETKTITRAHSIAEELIKLVSQPIKLTDHTIYITLSIGVCVFPNQQTHTLPVQQASDAIIKNADIAMYRTKHNNRNGFHFFENAMETNAIQRANIEKQLHVALQEKQFELYYQPIVHPDGALTGAEALVRWNSPSLGMVSPAEFIPIAEESGQIIDISQWILAEACQFINQLVSMPNATNIDYVSVNISPRQFCHPHFIQQLQSTVNQYQTDLSRLRLEITEGVAIDDIETAVEKIQQLVDLGFQFMLDDFGSGYSSLSYLHKLPLCAIKIDRSFISNINTESSNQVVVNAIIDIASHFKLGCIIEGVESVAEVDYFKNKNIQAIQGYYFHRPMRAEAFLALLSNPSLG
ncbi:EAL domain-containing protein [Alteromonadaceae bacterium BrNp21-10]|nr:EAL domain-containing protein [Alteromonadaceae bacterium BrNp21-10]